MRFKKVEVVARGGIEPPTRGFSVRRRARFPLTNPKTGKEFLAGPPNRPTRPSPYRTGTPPVQSRRRTAHAGQQLARDRTELPPNLSRVETLVTALRQVCLRPISDVSGIDMPAGKQTFITARRIHVKCETLHECPWHILTVRLFQPLLVRRHYDWHQLLI